MILLWIILGIILAIAIARMNKSNKLFWISFTAFALGIAAESIINKVNQKSSDDSAQVYPTQVVYDSPNYNSFLADEPNTTQSLVPNPVSKDTTPVHHGVDAIPQEPHKEVPTDPPNSTKTEKLS